MRKISGFQRSLRNRRIAGRSDRRLAVKLALPAIGETLVKDFWFGRRDFADIRRFLETHLRHADEQTRGASFTISTKMRQRSGGLRNKRLVAWKDGESFETALKIARTLWQALPKEEIEGEARQVEIEVPD